MEVLNFCSQFEFGTAWGVELMPEACGSGFESQIGTIYDDL